MKTISGFLITFFIICGITQSDILPEGKKKISFYFEVSGIDKFPDYVFLAYPVNKSGGVPQNECIVLENSKAVYLSCKYNSPAIFAIKKDIFNPEDIKSDENNRIENPKLDSFFANNKNLAGTKEIGCETFADVNAKYNSITDYYKIESIEKDALIIKKDKSVKKDKDGKDIKDEGSLYKDSENNNYTGYLYYSLPLISMIAFITFVYVRKRNK